MENQTLSDIIQETLAIEDPETDNLDSPELEDTESAVESLIEAEDDEDAGSELDEVEEDEEEEGDDDPRLGETFQVKVDGEKIEVTLEELKAGYQRQADYTRKAQALAAEREELETTVEAFSETLQTLQDLDSAWDESPVQVLAHFASSTDNPTYTVALLIKELAAADLLERDFLEMFGITPEVRDAWSKESEVETLKRKVSASESEKARQQQEIEYEAEVQKAIAEYDRQIDEILSTEGLELTGKQRNAFRSKLAQYAADNELTNLKAAYKALKYEEGEKKRKLAKKTEERAKQKKSASVVGRSGAGSSGAAPVSDNTDLSAVIKAAMAEQGLA